MDKVIVLPQVEEAWKNEPFYRNAGSEAEGSHVKCLVRPKLMTVNSL